MHSFKDIYSYSQNLNILYVEDDLILKEETAEILEDFFNIVDTAIDGEDGLNKYLKYKEETNQYYDLVITDINMPKMDGYELIKKIMEINFNQSIIVFSAYNESEKLINLIQQGIANFVMKPIEASKLMKMLYKTCQIISIQKQKNEFLVQQLRLAAMGKMIDSIAHQWIQPLNVIVMQSELLQVQSQENTLNIESIDNCIKSQSLQINHLVETLNEFRGFFREDLVVTEVLCKDIIDSVLLLMKDVLIQNTIEIKQNVDINCKVKVIPNEFKHVLINLLNNSIDSFNENNIISYNRRILLDTEIKNNSVFFYVYDNAGGIDKNIIDKIFDQNFTTKDKGTGMGLYMSALIIDKIGAKISASNYKDGVCFTIELKQ